MGIFDKYIPNFPFRRQQPMQPQPQQPMIPQQGQVDVETSKDNARLEGLAMFIDAPIDDIKETVNTILASGGTKLSKEELIKQMTNQARDLGKDKATAMYNLIKSSTNLSRDELMAQLIAMAKK